MQLTLRRLASNYIGNCFLYLPYRVRGNAVPTAWRFTAELFRRNTEVHRFTPTAHYIVLNLTKKKIPWSESASELYRPSDRRLSAK
jgi:hypothetical protein